MFPPWPRSSARGASPSPNAARSPSLPTAPFAAPRRARPSACQRPRSTPATAAPSMRVIMSATSRRAPPIRWASPCDWSRPEGFLEAVLEGEAAAAKRHALGLEAVDLRHVVARAAIDDLAAGHVVAQGAAA